MPDSIQTVRRPSLPEDLREEGRRLAEQVILEIVTQGHAEKRATKGLLREQIALAFWLAHLYYAKSNAGYLTTWPILRSGWGVEIRDASALLSVLVEDGFLRTEQEEWGPIPVVTYRATGKRPEAGLSATAEEAIRRSVSDGEPLQHPLWGWPLPSRACRSAPEGAEIDIYLDLIPEEVYAARRRELEGLKDGLKDLFS